ncbi:MAG: 30S ribosome-binding factor RbfA [Bacillota bacterium]|nr:30S ribosome-binding factor RbfA [Bacillota bacterium]HWR54994.1 30S ribosome-binding factor RbfA [Negativicutes bacterium]
MGQLRVDKVQELIKQEVSNMILRELKDPRIGFATVTQVAVSGDLRHAKIFVSLMGSEEQKLQTWEGLNSSLGFIRSELGKRIRLRYTPEINLQWDTSLDHSVKIQKLLDEVKKEEESRTHEG